MIYNENVFDRIKLIEDFSQNLIFSDPPYNLGSKWQITQDNKVEVNGKAVDFMNNKWEGLTGENLETLFKEFFRVLKYGGFCCLWSLNRQHLPFLYYANKAGFEQLQSINSFYISSFPKAMDLSKVLDRYYKEERKVICKGKDHVSGEKDKNSWESGYKLSYNITAPSSNLAKKYDGYKSSIVPLKEVSETLLVFRKPFKYKAIVTDIIAKEENNESDIHGCGINIDGNRVKLENGEKTPEESGKGTNCFWYEGKDEKNITHNNGRYPSNLYLIDGFNYTPEQIKEILINKQFHILENIGIDIEPLEYMTEEKQLEYICNYLNKFEVSKILDEQSGITKSWSGQNHNNFNPYKGNSLNKSNTEREGYYEGYSDDGGCSRILHKCKYELNEFDIFNYITKVSSFERNAGCENLENKKFGTYAQDEWFQQNMGNTPDANRLPVKNNHPTLKSMNLNYNLINLFLPPKEDYKNFKILIPFSGVLSEYIATLATGIPENNITGIEISKNYYIIGDERKKYWVKNNFYFIEEKNKKEEIKKNLKKVIKNTGFDFNKE